MSNLSVQGCNCIANTNYYGNSREISDNTTSNCLLGGDGIERYLEKKYTPRREAQEELNNKQSSLGITYAEAKRIMRQIEAKNTPKVSPTILVLQPQKFDPNKLEGYERTIYFLAKHACEEIENNYPELAEKAGCKQKTLFDKIISGINILGKPAYEIDSNGLLC